MKISKPAPKNMENIVHASFDKNVHEHERGKIYPGICLIDCGGNTRQRGCERYDVHQQNSEQSDTSKRIDWLDTSSLWDRRDILRQMQCS